MSNHKITRRQFIKSTTLLAGSTLITSNVFPFLNEETKRTAADQMILGKTGLKISRLGIGTGSLGGKIQRGLGTEGFNRLIRYAYGRGITYIDTAEAYQTHTYVRDAIKGLHREKLFILTKMPGNTENPLETIDRYRKELGTDYIDCLLIHCKVKQDWDETHKKLMEAFELAKDKKIILSHGVSCHTLPALEKAAKLKWVDVNLIRVNPQGAHIDMPYGPRDMKSNPSHLPAVLNQIKVMKRKKHGVIGMKIIGDGDFVNLEDRKKSIRYAMQPGLVDAVVVGFKSPAEIDEAIQNIDDALDKS